MFFSIKDFITNIKTLRIWNTPQWDSFIWCILILFFGLFQIWLTLLTHYILGVVLPPKRLFMDGILLFFSTAIVSSLVIDYHYFSSRPIGSDFLTRMLFGLFPLVIISLCAVLFTICYVVDQIPPEQLNKALPEFNQTFVTLMQIAILCMTMAYAFFVKAFIFREEKRQ